MLAGERIILRPFTLDDVNDVFLYTSDELVTKYLTWPPHTSLAETDKGVYHDVCHYAILRDEWLRR